MSKTSVDGVEDIETTVNVGKLAVASREVELDAPESRELFLGINVQSHGIDEFRQKFDGTFFHEKMSFYNSANDERKELFGSSECHELIADVFANLLDEVICDPELAEVLESVPKEPLNFFAQLSSGRGDDETQAKDDASRPDKQDIFKSILRSSEFSNAVELVLEGTIFNLLQEANMSEYDLSKTVPLAVNPTKDS